MGATLLTNLLGAISALNPLHVLFTNPLPTVLRHNVVVVATAGTRVPLSATSVPLVSGQVIVRMTDGQSGFVYVGGPTVSAANGYPLVAGESVPQVASDLNQVYVDASVNLNSVSYIAS